MTEALILLKEIKKLGQKMDQANFIPSGKKWFNAKEAEMYTGLCRKTLKTGIGKKTKTNFNCSWSRDELDRYMESRRNVTEA